jgi:hypothetical protein
MPQIWSWQLHFISMLSMHVGAVCLLYLNLLSYLFCFRSQLYAASFSLFQPQVTSDAFGDIEEEPVRYAKTWIAMFRSSESLLT